MGRHSFCPCAQPFGKWKHIPSGDCNAEPFISQPRFKHSPGWSDRRCSPTLLQVQTAALAALAPGGSVLPQHKCQQHVVHALVFPLRSKAGLSLDSGWTHQGPLAASEQVQRVLGNLYCCLSTACSAGSPKDLYAKFHTFYEQLKLCLVTLAMLCFATFTLVGIINKWQ